MSRSLNRVQLIGNLGSDPEVRSTTGGSRVATFSLATSRSWTGQNNEKQEKTEWHRCVAWEKLAEIVERWVKKGDKLYVEGRIEYRQWQDKEGQTRYTTEIRMEEMIMLSGRSGGGYQDDADGSSRSRSAPARSSAGAGAGSGGGDFEDFPGALEDGDDDLPF